MKVIERIVYPWDECAWPGEARMIRKEERMSQTRRQTWSAGSVVVSRGLESPPRAWNPDSLAAHHILLMNRL